MKGNCVNMTGSQRTSLPEAPQEASGPCSPDGQSRAGDASFRLLADALPQIVWTMQPDGRCTWFNQRWLDYSGCTLHDSLAHGWMQRVHPDDSARVSAFWAQARPGSAPCEIDCRLRRSDGVYRWMLARAAAQLDAAGQVSQRLGTLTDIDALKQAPLLLEKDLSINRVAGRVAQLGGWAIELPERTLTWSDENCLIHDVPPGYTPTLDEGISYFLPEHRHIVERHVQDCARHGIAYEFVLPKRTAKGRLIWVRSIGEAVRDAAGKIIRLQGAFQDISVQKKAEDRMLALEAQLITTLESITDGFCLVDTDWKFTFLNSQAERMLKRRRHDLLGKTLWQEFPEAVGTRIDRECRLAIQAQRTSRVQAFYPALESWFDFHIYPTQAGLAVYFQDVTERRQQQQEILRLNTQLEERVLLRTFELEIANRELESFAYSVSHDLRSPLNTLHAFSRLVVKIDGDRVSEKGRHYLERIGVSVKHMGELIEGLLTLAQVSRKQIHPEPVDLSDMARRIAHDHRARDPERQTQWHIQDGLLAQGDAPLLALLLQNLLDNAWKFTSREPLARIQVGSEPDADGNTVFHVRDNGAGFDMAFAPKLFGIFERLHAPEEFSGTGIGLATVKRVVDRHAGRVWAQSLPNQGAGFFFTLGRSKRPAP